MTGHQRMQWLIWLVLCLGTAGLACTAPMPLGYDPDPAPGVPTSALLLTAEAFPEGWSVDPCNGCEENGESYRTFGVPDKPGHVDQQVSYYSSDGEAEKAFRTYRASDLTEATHEVRRPSTVLRRPPDITYRSPIADEQYLACGVDVVPICRAGLRYGNYFVYFYFRLKSRYYYDYLEPEEVGNKASFDRAGLTLSVVEAVLRAMDAHYAELFGVSLPDE